MAGTNIGTLDIDNLTTNSHEWLGGRGVFSTEGKLAKTARPVVVILENDLSGEWQPTGNVNLGDAIVHAEGKQALFELPGCNIRARINGADAETDVTAFATPISVP